MPLSYYYYSIFFILKYDPHILNKSDYGRYRQKIWWLPKIFKISKIKVFGFMKKKKKANNSCYCCRLLSTLSRLRSVVKSTPHTHTQSTQILRKETRETEERTNEQKWTTRECSVSVFNPNTIVVGVWYLCLSLLFETFIPFFSYAVSVSCFVYSSS